MEEVSRQERTCPLCGAVWAWIGHADDPERCPSCDGKRRYPRFARRVRVLCRPRPWRPRPWRLARRVQHYD